MMAPSKSPAGSSGGERNSKRRKSSGAGPGGNSTSTGGAGPPGGYRQQHGPPGYGAPQMQQQGTYPQQQSYPPPHMPHPGTGGAPPYPMQHQQPMYSGWQQQQQHGQPHHYGSQHPPQQWMQQQQPQQMGIFRQQAPQGGPPGPPKGPGSPDRGHGATSYGYGASGGPPMANAGPPGSSSADRRSRGKQSPPKDGQTPPPTMQQPQGSSPPRPGAGSKTGPNPSASAWHHHQGTQSHPQQQHWGQQWGGGQAGPHMWPHGHQAAPPHHPHHGAQPPQHGMPPGGPKMWSPTGPPPPSGMASPPRSGGPHGPVPTPSAKSRSTPGGGPQDIMCKPLGSDPDDMMMMKAMATPGVTTSAPANSPMGGGSTNDSKDKGRGSYRCGKCGGPKKGHVCPYQPKLKRRPDEPPPEMRNASTQVEMDEWLVLRRLNLEIQGFPESYASEPMILEDMVGAEPHPSTHPGVPPGPIGGPGGGVHADMMGHIGGGGGGPAQPPPGTLLGGHEPSSPMAHGGRPPMGSRGAVRGPPPVMTSPIGGDPHRPPRHHLDHHQGHGGHLEIPRSETESSMPRPTPTARGGSPHGSEIAPAMTPSATLGPPSTPGVDPEEAQRSAATAGGR